MTTPTSDTPQRGDIWEVRFDPSEGDEIRKIRPALIMSVASAGRMRLHIVVPITGWRPQFARYFWMIPLLPSPESGLSKRSAADTFQVKSLSQSRFGQKLGVIAADSLDEIAAAVALCVGYAD